MNLSDRLKWMVEKIPDWLSPADSNYKDIVLSTRFRLARNLKNSPFPFSANADEKTKIYYRIEDILKSIKEPNGLRIFPFWTLEKIEKEFFVERHLVSPEFISDDRGRGLAVDFSEKISIMINEEDHLRIQCIYPGFCLEEAFVKIMEIDDEIGSLIPYAYKNTYGFLTSCPTNIGTGLRISMLLHIPGIVITGKIEKVLKDTIKEKLILRGYYGEGTESRGNLFQFSSSITLGKSELDIMEDFRKKITKIIEEELSSRDELLSTSKDLLEDRIYRAFGILRHARMLTSLEVMEHTSHLRMGVGFNIFKEVSLSTLNMLILFNQPAHLQMKFGRILEQRERDYIRGMFIRKNLSNEGSGV